MKTYTILVHTDTYYRVTVRAPDGARAAEQAHDANNWHDATVIAHESKADLWLDNASMPKERTA